MTTIRQESIEKLAKVLAIVKKYKAHGWCLELVQELEDVLEETPDDVARHDLPSRVMDDTKRNPRDDA